MRINNFKDLKIWRLSLIKQFVNLKKFLPKLFVILVVCYLLFLMKPAIFSQLRGTFKAKEVPQEYILFKDFIYGQKEPFQVLWVPQKQRFGFSSSRHRALAAMNYIEDNKCLEPFCDLKIKEYDREYFNCHPNERCFPADASFLANREVLPVLAEFSIKYVVIPYDSESEIFFYEREYDHEARQKLEDFLDTIIWLKKIELVEKIAIYEVVYD